MDEYPELGGPLYNIVYIMYLVVDGIILLNWYNDRPTIVNYLDKWKLLNSRTRILPFKRKPVSLLKLSKNIKNIQLRKQLSSTGASIISIHLSQSSRVIPELSAEPVNNRQGVDFLRNHGQRLFDDNPFFSSKKAYLWSVVPPLRQVCSRKVWPIFAKNGNKLARRIEESVNFIQTSITLSNCDARTNKKLYLFKLRLLLIPVSFWKSFLHVEKTENRTWQSDIFIKLKEYPTFCQLDHRD